jgi:hypothetical protein
MSLCLALNLVISPTPSWAAQTQSADTVDLSNEAEFNRTLGLMSSIAGANPKSEKLSALRDRSLYFAEGTLNDKVQMISTLQAANPQSPELTQLRSDVTDLASKIVQDIRKQLQDRGTGSQFDLQNKMLQKQLDDIAGKMLSASIPLPDQLLRDPSKPASPDNIINLGLEMFLAPSNVLALEAPTHFNYRVSQMMNAGGNAALSFSNQYLVYGIAMGVVAVAQWGMYYDRNPMAIAQLNHLLDPTGMAGFGAFMAVNHPITKLLSGIRAGTIPKSMIPYVGMAAGSLASSLFHDLWTDKDAHECVRSMWLGSPKVDDVACGKSFDTWMIHNKIMQYAPSIISMLLSAQLAGVIRSSIVSAGSSDSMKVIFKGMRIMPKAAYEASKGARAATIAAAGGFTPGGIAVAVGDFVLFIAVDAVISGPIDYYWQGFKIGNFDAVPWINKWGFHHEFWFPKAGEKQALSDAFDVEATNLPGVHGYFVDLFQTLQATGWKRPSKESCVPKDLDRNQPDEAMLKQMATIDPAAAAFYPGAQQKSSAQLRCEVLARPDDLLERYAKINQEWRTHLLSDFSSSQQNWMQVVAKFNDVYQASMTLGKYLADEKWAVTTGQKAQADLSRETLAKLIAPTAKSPNGAESEKSNPTSFQHIQTPELVDYVMASFACGTKVDLSQGVAPESSQPQGVFARAVSYIQSKTIGDSYIKTPFGSSFEFQPPNLTTENDHICRVAQGYAGARQRALLMPDGGVSPLAVFNGIWIADDGKKYSSLADYVFDHMNTAVYKSGGRYSNFPDWWSTNVTDTIAPVWSRYEASYQALVNRSFTPVLFEKSYWSGCSMTPAPHGRGGKPEADKSAFRNEITDGDGFLVATGPTAQRGKFGICKDGPTAYRAGNGVFLSIELEARNDLRGLYSIYASLFENFNGPRKERGQFLSLANGLINSVRTLNKDRLIDPTVAAKAAEPDDGLSLNEPDPNADTVASRMTAAQKTIQSLVGLIKSQMIASKISPEDMRVELAGKLAQQLSQLVTEGEKYSDVVNALSFEASTSRPTGQNLDTPKSSSPLERTGK